MARTQRLRRGSSRTEENAWRCTPPTTHDCDVSYRCGGGAGSGDDDVRCDDSDGGSGGVHLVARRVTGGESQRPHPILQRRWAAPPEKHKLRTDLTAGWGGWLSYGLVEEHGVGGGMSSQADTNEITFCSHDDDDDRYFKCYLKYFQYCCRTTRDCGWTIPCRIFRRLKVAGSLGLDG